MHYSAVKQGRFLSRPNRFIAHVEMDGKTEICHVKNTGRCRELLIPGARVWCAAAENPNRKTAYDLIAVEKGPYLVNMDSQAPNQAVGEWLRNGGLGTAQVVLPEQRFHDSRFDFYLERDGTPMFLEVKGVTLEENGICRFPDAPTQRGARHLRELMLAKEQGYDAAVLFVIQMAPVRYLEPNDRTDPAFGKALREAAEKGVAVLAVDCNITPDTMTIGNPVAVHL